MHCRYRLRTQYRSPEQVRYPTPPRTHMKFSIESIVPVSPDVFWSRMSISSVNAELAPLIRMTAPRQWREAHIETWPIDRKLFTSVILLFGILPVDVHSFRLQWTDPSRGFREASSTWLHKEWVHERTTRSCTGGCVVSDSVSVQTRLPFLTWLLLPIYRAVFRHRHRKLLAIYRRTRDRRLLMCCEPILTGTTDPTRLK